MGRAKRWLKGLFGIKSKEKYEMEYSVQPKDKNRWSSGPLERNGTVSCHNPKTIIPPNITPAEAAWLRSFYCEPDNEQKQHARAVAAATAAAADAAVAAAQAAVTVVRLTSQGRERLAAAKIQTAFRGYLARKALRALKGLVRIQALARGFLMRKQVAATLQRMQALIRAQESVRALKARGFINNAESFPPQVRARKSLGDFEEHPAPSLDSRRLSTSAANALDENAKIVEVDSGCWPKSRSKRAANTWMSDPSAKAMSSPLERNNLADQQWGLIRVCAERYPNYMVINTESLKGKQRSQSAPKQRPEPGPIRSLSLLELMESRNNLSGVRMPTPSSRAQEAINIKNAVVGKTRQVS